MVKIKGLANMNFFFFKLSLISFEAPMEACDFFGTCCVAPGLCKH